MFGPVVAVDVFSARGTDGAASLRGWHVDLRGGRRGMAERVTVGGGGLPDGYHELQSGAVDYRPWTAPDRRV